ncbi:DUF1652 domain-containing protein [Pseudomonas sp. Bout1]|uniref:DUF1652 domain-containing protein n=1 Tax=Pseudomonas sp. Bout1 TaxID=3048600 RepID=UPI002AB4192C|nr:DUF1652 domain-containing protein [Pseudomonas sp. Bout1]MDY7533530.1 DUF1652 domain-containing protein [Pseudomonas sp. Bout1]MEB0187259.1 DUF1652 domain-containing protein [Pseudomonas sp. Bout1]
MLSDLELRGIIEGSFLPKRCEVTKAPDASLTVKVYHEIDHDRVDLVVTGICANKLDSSRAICNLITELREDLKHTHTPAPALKRAGARPFY